jgi:hypothetical protein
MRTPRMPAAQPPPPAPTADNAAAEAARVGAERDAAIAQRTAGRRSTIVAGQKIAEEDQMARGLEKMNARVMRQTRLG